jgi:hypothetical protein
MMNMRKNIENEVSLKQYELNSKSEHTYWRPDVVAFASALEAKLSSNDSSPNWLIEQLAQEVGELINAFNNKMDSGPVQTRLLRWRTLP